MFSLSVSSGEPLSRTATEKNKICFSQLSQTELVQKICLPVPSEKADKAEKAAAKASEFNITPRFAVAVTATATAELTQVHRQGSKLTPRRPSVETVRSQHQTPPPPYESLIA